MLITRRQFDILCDRYTLSPTQKKIAGLLLTGKTTDHELRESISKSQTALATHIQRLLRKTFCRNKSDFILRFWRDSQNVRPEP